MFLLLFIDIAQNIKLRPKGCCVYCVLRVLTRLRVKAREYQ